MSVLDAPMPGPRGLTPVLPFFTAGCAAHYRILAGERVHGWHGVRILVVGEE